MKKKTLTALALGAATVATGMASNVHADNVTVTKEEVGDQTKITTTTTKTEASQEKINQDKQAVSDQQKVVDQSKSDMESAQSTVNSDKSKVESAQNSVDSAKQALDNAKNPQQAVANQESKVQDDQNKVNQDQTNINNTQNDIKNDQANVAQDQQNINNAGQKVQQDQNKLSQDQSKLDQAQQTQQNDQNKVNDTQSKINNLISQSNEVPDINVTQDYIDGVKGNKNFTTLNAPEYKNNDSTPVNIANLTNDQQKEINTFALNLLNQIRQKMGDQPFVLNQNMIDFANSVATDYENDKWNINNWMTYINEGKSQAGHDDAAIYKESGKYGLEQDPYASAPYYVGANWYEDATVIGKPTTMGQLKEDVYQGIFNLLNDEGHAKDLLYKGIQAGKSQVYGNKAGKLGVSVDSLGQLHILTAYDDQIADMSKFNGKDIQTSSTSDLQNQKNSLENQLAQQKQQVANDQQTVNDLQNQVNADKEQIKNDTPTALQQKLEQDQKKLSDDQTKLNDLQKQLTQDQNQLSQDQAKLDELRKAQVSPEEIQKAQDAYNDAVKALNDAQSQMNKDSDSLAKAQQAYIDAQNKLNELETILKNDEKTVTTVDVQWIKHPHTTAEMGNKVVLSGSHQNTSSAVTGYSVNTVSSTVSENNTVHADLVSEVKAAQATTVKSDDNSNVIYFTSEAPQSSVKKEAKQNTMPQMGDENSKATLWGEISLAMAGVLATLGLAKRKRHE